MFLFLLALYSILDLKNFPTTDFFLIWQKILSTPTDIKYETIWYPYRLYFFNKPKNFVLFKKNWDCPHQIGAVNPL